MKLKRKIIFFSAAFGVTFLVFFLLAYKYSDLKGLRRFLVSIKIAGVLTLASFGSTATAKDSQFLPAVDGFTSQPSTLRPATSPSKNTPQFGTKTATGAAGSSESGSNSAKHSPAVSKGRPALKPIDRPDVFKKSKDNDQCPVGEPGRGPSSEMIINSDSQDKKIVITDRDVKRCMTEKDRKRFDDQAFNEKIYKTEIGIRVSNPDEVYTKNYRREPSTIYIEKSKTGDIEIIAAIVDNKSGRLKLNSPITPEEYRDLINQKNIDLELTALRRDPQTGFMNAKSIEEYFTIERAKEQGLVENYRCPKLYLGEGNTDFVELSGSNQYELKAVVQHKYKSYEDSAKDIIKNIRINSQMK